MKIIPAPIQSAIDIMAAHLAQQRCQSSVDGISLYRGPNGCKCAVGALIPDELYEQAGCMEDIPIDDLLVASDEIRHYLVEHYGDYYLREFLYAVQNYHDHGSYMAAVLLNEEAGALQAAITDDMECIYRRVAA